MMRMVVAGVVALALGGCEDDCEKFVNKTTTALEQYSHKETTHEQAVAAVDKCRVEVAKQPNAPVLRCVLAAETDGAVLDCIKAGLAAAKSVKPAAPATPVTPATP